MTASIANNSIGTSKAIISLPPVDNNRNLCASLAHFVRASTGPLNEKMVKQLYANEAVMN